MPSKMSKIGQWACFRLKALDERALNDPPINSTDGIGRDFIGSQVKERLELKAATKASVGYPTWPRERRKGGQIGGEQRLKTMTADA